jgi:hypothetical protein
MRSVMTGLYFPGKTGGPTRANMYEPQDYILATKMIQKGFFQDQDRHTLTPTEENIIDLAQSYYNLRIRTFDPATGSHF